MSGSPQRIVVAGDWHSDLHWAVGVIEQLPSLLPDEHPRRIMHLGDFGIWPGRAGSLFIEAVEDALAEVDGELWFIDGNHEDFSQLDDVRASSVPGVRIAFYSGTRIEPLIQWMPRGYRWTWHDRTWLALGGATSVDRPARVEGRDWWAGERISLRDAQHVTAAGKADVMLTHDAPAGVPLRLGTPPSWWEIEPAEDHRDLLGVMVDEIEPRWLMHGHYHLSHDTTVERPYGPLNVTGLDQNGALRGNYRVLNVETMEWQT